MKLNVLRVWHSEVCIVASKAGIPSTSRIFAVLEPTTLPIAMPGALSSTALIEISSSGAEVPKATIVRLTINAGTPRRSERFTAPLTRASPANSKITSPRPDSNHGINIRSFLYNRTALCRCGTGHNRRILSVSAVWTRASASCRTTQACP